MKNIIAGIMAIFSGFVGCSAQQQGFKSVDANEFASVIADSSVVRLDVRSADEYAAGHIADALNIDVLKPDFESKAVSSLPKDKTIALYCRSGRRSKKAADILASNGFSVIELNTGFSGWVAAGKDFVK